MFDAARIDLVAGRYVPHIDYIDFEGFDFTGAALKMQVRDRYNGGLARADLAQVTTAAAEGVRIDQVSEAGGVTTTRIAWRINETTMEAMPKPADVDADLALVWDLHITPSGGAKFVAARGKFLVQAGVTE